MNANRYLFINCKGRLLEFKRPLIMGIVNVTPDSFYGKSRFTTVDEAVAGAGRIIEEGGDIIDIGGCSTRPGVKPADEKSEKERVIPVIEAVSKKFPGAVISVDTFRSAIASLAVVAGAAMVNDISGGTMDPAMYDTVSSLRVPYILTHIQNRPENMQEDPHDSDVVNEIIDFLVLRVSLLRKAGIADIILDPGFGFGKTVEHNYEILRRLNDFRIFSMPVLAGLSRKSMINRVAGIKPEDALAGTSALHAVALINGADILRVHDVREAVQVVKVMEEYNRVR
ncbi:MAG: dihydropteroate synthase [Bacteroidetes bacterium]|nr:dihydropteroate synthase [Bacteroidota bacterium]